MTQHDLPYLSLLSSILENGVRKENRTGVDTIGLLGYQMRFDLTAGFPLLTSKKLPLRWIFEELRWFLSGSVDVRDLQAAGVDIWDEWATEAHNKKHGREWWNMGPIYSHQWRNFGATPILNTYGDPDTNIIVLDERNQRKCVGYASNGFDQIAWLSGQFYAKSNSRRLILTGWNPAEADLVALPPCHTFSQWTVQDDKLHCHLFQRSADVFLGVPFNIASYSLLTHMFAKACGLQVGSFVHTLHDVHIYENHVDQVKEQLSRTPPASPQIVLSDDVASLHVWDVKWEHISLVGYNPLAKLSADVAV